MLRAWEVGTSMCHATATRLANETVAVLALAWDGLSNDEIARWLACTEANVRYHLSRAMDQLGACNRTHACKRALAEGYNLHDLPAKLAQH